MTVGPIVTAGETVYAPIPVPGARAIIDGIPVFCAFDELRKPEELIDFPLNPNTHPQEQIAKLARIYRGNGIRQPCIVSSRSGYLTKGHGRKLAALYSDGTLGALSMFPVQIQSYASEALEYADIIADNQLADESELDRATLKELVGKLDTGEISLELTGLDLSAIEEMMTAAPPINATIEDETDEQTKAQKKWKVKAGQVWQMGSHRLTCGKRNVKIAALLLERYKAATGEAPELI